jgi:cytochrome b561
MQSDFDRYDRLSIALHWLTAILIVGLWVLAQVIDAFPNGVMRTFVRSLHIGLGLSLMGLLVLRLLWRFTFGRKLAPVDAGLLGRLSTYGHWLLYATLAVALGAGLANAWVRGDTLFGMFNFGSGASSDRALRRLIGSVHEVAANAILVLGGLHAVAALLHHFVLGDATLRRMLPSRWVQAKQA